MNRGYMRAHLERAEDGQPLRFVAATEGRKADGLDLRMDGGRLERYRANPIFGYGHMYFGRDSLPIGRATNVAVDGDRRLMIDVEFDSDDEFAQTVERKYRGGFMSAVSIGFDVHEWEDPNDNMWRGGVATDWELLEVSAVPIPMDASAVVNSGRSLRDDFDRVLEQMPVDPSVTVERDSGALTRSVRVSEDVIRRADPLMLSAAIGRALATSEVDTTPTPEPAPAAPRSEPEVPPAEPHGEPEAGSDLTAEIAALRSELAEVKTLLSAPASRGAIPSHDTAVVESEWDGPKAVADAPQDSTVLRYMHAWVDSDGDADTKTAYKFPHHAPREGAPANLPAVRNALARLPQADIPESARAAVEKHLRNHLEAQEADEDESRSAGQPTFDAADVAAFPL